MHEEDDGRVDVTGAGAHRQPFQRVSPMEVSTDLAVLDGADGGTVAQVAVDDVELMERFAQRLAVSSAMKRWRCRGRRNDGMPFSR